MIKRRIMYLIILAVSFWIMLMYDGVFMEGIFAVAVLLPVVCIILKYITIASVFVNWTSDSIKTERGKAINVMTAIKNYFFLPVNRVTITFELEDVLGNKEEYKIVTNLLPHMKRYCAMELCPNYSGAVLVRLKSVKINDILGLTSASKKIGSVLTLMVFPKPCECIPVTVENNVRYKEESDEYSDTVSGNDKSQIFDISQYQAGDSIRDVHWKLSSKTDNLMVKRYSFPVEKQINVFIDYGKPDDKGITTAGVGRFFERLYGFLNELEKNNESVNIYAYTGSEGECIQINKEDILYLNINNSSYADTVCRNFMNSIGMGGNILISSRITKKELSEYDNLSAYYINMDDLYSDKENTTKELFIQDTQIIGIYMDAPDEEKGALASHGDELYINKDDEEVEAYTYIFRVVLVLLGSIIPMLIFYDVLVVYRSTPVKVVIFPVLAVVIMIISTYIKSRGIKVLYMAGAITGAALLLGINNIIDGTLKSIEAFGNSMLYYESGYGLSMLYRDEITYFVAFVAFIYAVMLFIFTWNSISVTIHVILTIPPVALCLAYGCVPANTYTVLYAVYMTGVLVYSITYRNIVKSEKGVLKKAFYESTINIGAVLAYTVMVITAAIMLINAVKGYHRPKVLNNMKAEINTFLDDFSLEKKKIENTTATGGLSSGKLGTVNKVSYSGVTVLTVSVTGKLNFPLYLRGYIGSEYTGSSWDTISDIEDIMMENELEGTGLSMHGIYNLPYYMISEENKGIAETGLGKVNSGNVTVENMNQADSTYYIPYGAFISPDVVVVKDGTLINNVYGEKSYHVYQLQGIDNLDEYMNMSYDSEDNDNIFDNYHAQEIAYRNIAYEYYSYYDGDKATGERLKREMPWEYTIDDITYNLYDGPEKIGYEPYIQAVKDYLSQNYEYSLSPGKLDDGQDFIDRFMDERKGYCSYFATIATEMFRIYGIPARYVEGYYVKPTAVEMIGYYKNNAAKLDVRDENAHAWTEIYIDGLGFLPVETTPGYTGVNYSYEEETTTEPATSGSHANVSTTEPKESDTSDLQKETTSETTTVSYGQEEESEGVRLFGFMKNKYIVAVIIAVIILTAILGRKSHYDRKNDEIIRRRKRSAEALMWESQLEKMACVIRPVLNLSSSATREQLADEIVRYTEGSERHKEELDRKEVESMFLIFDKAVYSENGADREEMKKAAATASNIMDELYINQSVIRKLFIKYIKCLYLK